MEEVHYVIIDPVKQEILYKQYGGGYGQKFIDKLAEIRVDHPNAEWHNITHGKCPTWVKRLCKQGYQEVIQW